MVGDPFNACVKCAYDIQQLCLVQLIRDLKYLTTLPNEADKCFGDSLLIQFKRPLHIWHLRHEIFKDRSNRIMFKIKAGILALAEQRDLPAKSATVAKRFCKHGDTMFRFLFDSAVGPTNNAAQQTLCQAIIDR
jgi:hypothetical protein